MSDGMLVPESRMNPALILRRAPRYYKGALLTLIVGLCGTAMVYGLTKQLYRSSSVVVYQQSMPREYVSQDLRQAAAQFKDMLMSRERLRKVAAELTPYADVASVEAAVDKMEERLEFKPRGGSTFAIEFTHHIPQMAQDVVRSLATSLVEDDRVRSATSAAQTRSFLDTEITTLEKGVAERQVQLENFLIGNPDIANLAPVEGAATDDGSPSNLAQIMALEVQLARLRDGKPVVGPSVVPDSRPDPEFLETRRNAENQVKQARRDLTDRLDRFTTQHPDVILAQRRLQRAEETLQALSGRARPGTVSSVGTRIPTADPEIARLEQQLGRLRQRSRRASLRAESARTLQLDVRRQSLQQELNDARERLGRLREQRFRAAMSESMQASTELSRLSVLNEAHLPGQPVSNRKVKMGLAALMFALACSLGWALVRAATDDRLFSTNDVVHMTSLRVLGALPPSAFKAGGHGS